MERVTGIGGVFLKVRDVDRMAEWYARNLGMEVDPQWKGLVFSWTAGQRPDRPGSTTWSLFRQDSGYFGTGTATVLLNYRVDDLDAMLSQLRANGCAVEEKVSEYGRFGWVTDPEGNRIELWEPPAGA